MRVWQAKPGPEVAHRFGSQAMDAEAGTFQRLCSRGRKVAATISGFYASSLLFVGKLPAQVLQLKWVANNSTLVRIRGELVYSSQ